VIDVVPDELRDKLGIAVAKRTYRAYRELHDSDRWQRLENEGARPQRVLWASTGTKDPDAPDTLYIEALAAPEDAASLAKIKHEVKELANAFPLYTVAEEGAGRL